MPFLINVISLSDHSATFLDEANVYGNSTGILKTSNHRMFFLILKSLHIFISKTKLQ